MSDCPVEKFHECQDWRMDPSISAVLPPVAAVLSVNHLHPNTSAWAKLTGINVCHSDNSNESYFLKVSIGHHGREALRGEFEATSAIYTIIPDFCPKPVGWGSLSGAEDTHFYICKWHNFAEGVPAPESFCKKLTTLHSSLTSPEGKFGFHCTTYNGNLPQDNTWNDSWEDFFTNGLRDVLRIREERAGRNEELDNLLPALFEKVIPRLLRPLERGGQKVIPSLVHGDLWYGNARVDSATGEAIVFDPASFWAHNEYELGNWRPNRNKFDDKYFTAYKSRIKPSEPERDFDDRIVLYGLRFSLNAATLFPDQAMFLELAINDIRTLTEKFASDAQT